MSGFTGYYSGFLTNFEGSTGFMDMLSTATTSIPVVQSGGVTGYARYFYLGNLLIQFSDGIVGERGQGTSYTQPYPTTFSSAPYTVLISYTNTNNNSGYATLESTGSTGFEFRVGGNNGNVTWMAIGPR
jgi:hypothetical protein